MTERLNHREEKQVVQGTVFPTHSAGDLHQPHQQISIDKSMISYKGLLSSVQYLPKKPQKWGLKAWVLADFTDNFYSSPALFKDLTDHGFGACATARKIHRGIPKSISDAWLKKGEVLNSSVLSLVWWDKRDVLLLSMFHDDSMVSRSRRSRAAVGGVENIEKP